MSVVAVFAAGVSVSVSGTAPAGATAGVTQPIAAGTSFTCALTAAQGVQCWGYNNDGQLGDGTYTDSLTAVDVSGLTSGVTAIAAGGYHTCAVTTAGGVKCWGDNSAGQLGDGTYDASPTPVDASGLTSGVAAIAAGDLNTCALTTAGGVKCWGYDAGSGTPVDVTGLTSGVTAIAVGLHHMCALTAAGGVQCWGSNTFGQLGDGTTTDSTTPVDVTGLTAGATAIAAGDWHTCAAMASGGTKCWGRNLAGQLGDGTLTDSSTPVDVLGISSHLTTITAGQDHTCALTTAGSVQCWGYNYTGQVGDGTTSARLTPVVVTGLTSGVTAITAGDQHTCALSASGRLRCWGDDSSGELGDGTYANAAAPVDVTGLTSGVTAITAGFYHTCAVTAGGGVKCWGTNYYGQLGNGTTTNSWAPVDVTGLTSGVTSIASDQHDTCALTAAGGVKCWGENFAGQLGDGTTTERLTPVDVTGLTSGVTAITASGSHACALTASGGVKCWGANDFGELGDGTTTQRLTPVDVTGLTSGVTAISAGGPDTCALMAAGGAKCWGNNSRGQVGDGTTTQRLTPVDVTGLTSDVAAIAAGNQYACALTIAGGMKCWGLNGYGELGDGTTTQRLTPVDVVGLTSGVTAIAPAPADFVTCAVTTGGGAKCWGYDGYGALGDGTYTNSSAPVDVTNLSSGVTAIAASGLHACALTAAGGAKCWGDNSFGELGVNNGWSPLDAIGSFYVSATVPALPTGLVATARTGSVSVAFNAPANDGGETINSYTVSCAGTGATPGSNSGTSSPIVVTGLDNGKTYTCRATATNNVGASINSAASNSFVPSLCMSRCISVGDRAMFEGNSGTRTMSFPVTLSTPASSTVTVQYSVTGMTATGGTKPGSGVDFKLKSGTLTFKPNAQTGKTAISADIAVTVYGDTTVEPDETLAVTLSSPIGGGYVLGRRVGTGTIRNDDGITSRLTLGVADTSIMRAAAGNQNLEFPVTLSAKAATAFSVNYAITPGTAAYSKTSVAGGGYGGAKTSGTLKFAINAITKSISIPIWADATHDPTKTFTITLSGLTGTGVTIIGSSATATILG
jgi:alpha-tubulin suppressor-like RCC1 family protein